MNSLFFQYLKEIFFESTQRVFTLFDILGIIILLLPNLTAQYITYAPYIRTIGAIIFFASFFLANYALYKKYASDKAEIQMVVGDQFFNSSSGSRSHPINGCRNSPHGFNKEGLPDWGSLYTVIEITNIGLEDGQLRWKLDKEKTKLPQLFDFDNYRIEFNPPKVIHPRKVPPDAPAFFFDIVFTDQDPYKFASAIKDLVLRYEQYEIALQYWTVRVDGDSNPRTLIIKGGFQNFYHSVIKHWEDFGYPDLIDHARILE